MISVGSDAGSDPSLVCLYPGQCMRINTGGPIPAGADAVVQVEDTKLVKATEDGKEELQIEILVNPAVGLDIRCGYSRLDFQKTFVQCLFFKARRQRHRSGSGGSVEEFCARCC